MDVDTGSGLTPAFSPDGKFIAVGNRNNTTRLFETSTGKLLHNLPQKMSQELAFSPDGKVLAVAYVDGSIVLWNVATGELKHSAATGAQEVYTLDWSPSGDVLVTAGRLGKIVLWDAQKLKPLKELDAPEWVICVRFSKDGCRLFTAGGSEDSGKGDRKLTAWEVRNASDK